MALIPPKKRDAYEDAVRSSTLYLFVFCLFFGSLLTCLTTTFAAQWPESKIVRNYSSGAQPPFNVSDETRQYNSRCGKGITTYLECSWELAKIPRHDVELGKTELVLRSVHDDKILLREKFNEVWDCLTFNPRTRKYLLGSKNEHGVKVSLRGLVYLDEQKAIFQDTIFGKQGFEASSGKLSPDGRYLVFVASSSEEPAHGLYVMDSDTDTFQFLGTPPAPPPLELENQADRETVSRSWAWESSERSYTDLEPSILKFSEPHVLQVSFGKDSFRQRGKNRTIKVWNLDKLYQQSQGGAMGQNQPPTLPPGHDIKISGNKSALEKQDARFIDFIDSIKPEDIDSFLFKPSKSSAYHYETAQGRIKVRVDDYILEKIAYEMTQGPFATEKATTTFWKTKDNLYFFMFIGGLAVTERLFGPFQLKGEQFVFAAKTQEKKSGRMKSDSLKRILLDAEWDKLNPNPISPSGGPPRRWWTYEISPPFPSVWPPAPDLTLYYYVYADGHDFSGGLSDGVYITAPWARVEVDLKGSADPKFKLLSTKIREIGIQGVRPLSKEEVAVYELGETVEAYLGNLTGLPDEKDRAVSDLRRYYCAWCGDSGGIAKEIRPLHKSFFKWLGCE